MKKCDTYYRYSKWATVVQKIQLSMTKLGTHDEIRRFDGTWHTTPWCRQRWAAGQLKQLPLPPSWLPRRQQSHRRRSWTNRRPTAGTAETRTKIVKKSKLHNALKWYFRQNKSRFTAPFFRAANPGQKSLVQARCAQQTSHGRISFICTLSVSAVSRGHHSLVSLGIAYRFVFTRRMYEYLPYPV